MQHCELGCFPMKTKYGTGIAMFVVEDIFVQVVREPVKFYCGMILLC